MIDAELAELIEHLHRLRTFEGDRGHEYWTQVIAQLRRLHALVRLHERHCHRDLAWEAQFLSQASPY
jgi:hypothetical protein